MENLTTVTKEQDKEEMIDLDAYGKFRHRVEKNGCGKTWVCKLGDMLEQNTHCPHCNQDNHNITSLQYCQECLNSGGSFSEAVSSVDLVVSD